MSESQGSQGLCDQEGAQRRRSGAWGFRPKLKTIRREEGEQEKEGLLSVTRGERSGVDRSPRGPQRWATLREETGDCGEERKRRRDGAPDYFPRGL